MRVLVVRAAEDARRTMARLAAAGHKAIVSPAIVVRPVTCALPEGRFEAALATSGHAFVDPQPLRRLSGVPLFVVGARTADAARAAGWPTPECIAPNALHLAEHVKESLPSGARVIYFAGRDRRPDLEHALAGSHDLCVVEVYAADEADSLSNEAGAALAEGGVEAVLHYSRRSAEIFLRLAARAKLAPTLLLARHVAISAEAAAPLVAAGLNVVVARSPDENGMFAAFGGPTDAPA